jgi:putative glutamine amidotransferase
MKLPVIGITGGLTSQSTDGPAAFILRQNYARAVAAVGGAPLLIPPLAQEDVIRAIYERLDGVLLSGGGDIAPHFYGEEPHPTTHEIDIDRDNAEFWLVRRALEDSKPLLGICRGIQVLNVALGGTLYQDIASQIGNSIDHTITKRADSEWRYMAHDISLEPSSLLARVLEATCLPTNSAHHQSIKDLAPGLRITGRSPDGVIEAVEVVNSGYALAVQSHPEALWAAVEPRWQAMFAAFVSAARESML